MEYPIEVYTALKEYFKENHEMEIEEDEIEEMSLNDVLSYYLEWEGIIGYDNIIYAIFQEKIWDFIQELEYNNNVEKRRGNKNPSVDISYVIDRLSHMFK